MKPETVVAAILQTAAQRLAKWLPHFRPRSNFETGLSERDLSFQFATAFLQHFPKGMVAMDLAFAKTPGRSAATGLDTYLFTKECACLLECRQDLYEKYNIRDIAADMTQMTDSLAQRVQQHYQGTAEPRLMMGVILAAAWGDQGAPPPWPAEGLPPHWLYGSLQVAADQVAPAHHGNPRVLYWLYAVSPPMAMTPRDNPEEEWLVDEEQQGLTPPTSALTPDEFAADGWVYEGGQQAQALEAAGARFEPGNPAHGKFTLVFSPTTQRLVGAFRIIKKIPAELISRGWIYRDSLVAKLLVTSGVEYVKGNPLPNAVFVFDKAHGTTILGHYRLPQAAR